MIVVVEGEADCNRTPMCRESCLRIGRLDWCCGCMLLPV